MIRRRGVLGALAGAPIAAKAAAQSAGIMAAPGPNPSPIISGEAFGSGGQRASRIAERAESSWIPDEIARLGRELLQLEETRRARLQQAIRNVSRLDPDLAEARSFSLSHKIRAQAHRDVDRHMAESGSQIRRMIDEYRARLGELL